MGVWSTTIIAWYCCPNPCRSPGSEVCRQQHATQLETHQLWPRDRGLTQLWLFFSAAGVEGHLSCPVDARDCQPNSQAQKIGFPGERLTQLDLLLYGNVIDVKAEIARSPVGGAMRSISSWLAVMNKMRGSGGHRRFLLTRRTRCRATSLASCTRPFEKICCGISMPPRTNARNPIAVPGKDPVGEKHHTRH